MTDDKNTGDKTLHAPSKTLSLKRPVEAGVVRQSFSHGRSKAVVVEKVKRRTLGPGEQRPEVKIEPKVEAPAPVAAAPVAAPAAPVAKVAAPAAPAARAPASGRGAPQRPSQGNRPSSGSGVVLRTLTEDERDARTQALVEARKREIEERATAEIEAKARNDREEIERVEREAAAIRQKEEDQRLKREEELRRKSEEAAQRLLGDAAPAVDAPAANKAAPAGPQSTKPLADTGLTTVRRPLPAPGVAGRLRNDEEEEARPVRRPGGVVRPAVAPKPERTRGTDDRRRGRLTVTAATGGGDEERTRSLAAFRRRVQRLKGHQADEP